MSEECIRVALGASLCLFIEGREALAALHQLDIGECPVAVVEEAGEEDRELCSHRPRDAEVILLAHEAFSRAGERGGLRLHLHSRLVGDLHRVHCLLPAARLHHQEVVKGHPLVTQQVEAQQVHLPPRRDWEALRERSHSAEHAQHVHDLLPALEGVFAGGVAGLLAPAARGGGGPAGEFGGEGAEGGEGGAGAVGGGVVVPPLAGQCALADGEVVGLAGGTVGEARAGVGERAGGGCGRAE